jgi:hypothetical protein
MVDPYVSRRFLLLTGAVAGVSTLLSGNFRLAHAATDPLSGEQLYRDVVAYDELGPHRTASPQDLATTAWLEKNFKEAGFDVARQPLDVTYHEPLAHHLTVKSEKIEGFPLWPPMQTPESGIEAPLAFLSPDCPVANMQGKIAVMRLPYVGRGVSLGRPEYRKPVIDALKMGAAALVIITEGPAGDLIALNALPPGGLGKDTPLAPMLLVPGRVSAQLTEAAKQSEKAQLILRVKTREKAQAFNLACRLKCGPRWIVLSTPQSGWFHCAGERGPGVAIELALARWAAQRKSDISLYCLVTSGHEVAGIGADSGFTAPFLPTPKETALWVFLGSSVATRAWHLPPNPAKPGKGPVPLPSPDPERTLYGSPALLDDLRKLFAGLAGLEVPEPASGEGGAGSPTPQELREALAHGYAPGVGVKGNHLYQHAMGDHANATSAEILEPTARAFAALLEKFGL